MNKTLISPKEAPIQNVTVYNDRGSVTRQARVTLQQGVQHVVFEDLPTCVITDAIRVEGKGEAVIMEVSHKEQYKGEGKNRNERVSEITEEIKQVKQQIQRLNALESRIKRRSDLLSKARSTIHNTILEKNSKNQDAQQPSGITHLVTKDGGALVQDNVRHFLKWHAEERRSLDEGLSQVKDDLQQLTKRKQQLEHEQSRLETPLTATGLKGYNVVVTVDSSHEDNEVELSLIYLVHNASWQASYDMRFDSAENSFVMTYFGSITQNTTEDWKNVNLSLSTAQPSLGGAPPVLHTIYASIRKPVAFRRQTRAKKKSRGFSRVSDLVEQSAVLDVLHDDMSSDEEDEEDDQSIEAAVTMVNKGVTSSTFNISRPATIPSDNLPHKVTIAENLSFSGAEFEYKTVPRRVPKAFLKVKSRNETEYQFLGGEVAVYFDGSFVVSSSIKNAMINQEFEVFVGADPSLSVEYKPVVRRRRDKGLMRGHNLSNVQRKIVIKNLKNVATKVSAIDLIPLSHSRDISIQNIIPPLSDEVEIEEYEVPNNKSSVIANKVKLSKQGIVSWKLVVPAGETVNIPLEYSVKWPISEQLRQEDF